VSEHLYSAARKRRPRRPGGDGPAWPCGPAVPLIFDRLEYLQQQINAARRPKPVDMLLITHDGYLSLALSQYFFKRTRTHICPTPEEAESFFRQNPLPRIVIDLDGITIPVLRALDTVRSWQKKRPGISITLLTSTRSPAAASFIAAASGCRVIERHLEIVILLYLLMQQPCSPRPIQANYTRANDNLSPREWTLLLEVAKGRSLKAIASSLEKPYHSVVYTLGRVAGRLGLNNRKALIYLLHELSLAPAEKHLFVSR